MTDKPLSFPKWIPDPSDPAGGDAVDTAAEEAMLLELRRLRSDEWLEKAAQEIGDRCEGLGTLPNGHNQRAEIIAAILRKHRDGKS